ncbi:MAG: RNA polymerase sigma factor [Terriglobales bacterium]
MTDFEALYAHYSRDIYRFALYLCGNHAEAEDIASETFVRVWNATGRIRAATAKSYLFAIARNCYLERLRRGARETQLNETTPDSTANPYADAERRIELDRVLGELQQLPEVDRTVLLLRVQEEWSYQEIADAVQLSLPAVKVKIHRARLKLAQWRAAQEIRR